MSKLYNHTQIGYLMLIAMGIALVFIIGLMAVTSFNWVAVFVLAVLAVTAFIFATLKITIDRELLSISFGPGLIRKSFPLKDIESQYPVKNPWYYGWGIHLTPHGWLFNVSGSYAIKLNMKNGKKYLIGTDEPKVLSEAIQRALDDLK